MARRGEHETTTTVVQDAAADDLRADGPETITSQAIPRVAPDISVIPDRFELLGVLGSGGMGQVLRVRDRSLNREVAVKLVQKLDSERARERFRREASAVGTLHHPNIITVHDVAPGGEYLVMELIEGESLGDRLRREKRLPVDEVRRIGAALLGALAAAHDAGIVHRDVKPGNILLGTDGAVKLSDFGIASFGESELTHTGQVVGTPAYMAPEQLRARNVDQRADVYSAGATLFEAATGIRLNDRSGAVDDPQRAILDATGDAGLARAIARAVREKEVERYATAVEFGEALVWRPVEPSRRRWLRPVLAVAALLASGIAVTTVAIRSTHSREETVARTTTVAMLPFTNHAGDSRLDFAASGLPHLLGKQLERDPNLRVLGYYRIRARVTEPDASLSAWRDAAHTLGADVIVHGELRSAGDGVSVAIVVERHDGTVERIERQAAVDRVPRIVQELAAPVAGTARGTTSSLAAGSAIDFEVERELQLGIAAFERLDLETASRHLGAALVRDDSVVEARYYLAILAWWRGEDPKPDIARALAGTPGAAEREFLEGLQLLAALDYPRGLDHFRDLARRMPDHRDVQYGLFEAQFHGGYPTDAMTSYRRLRELAPQFEVGSEHTLLYYLTRGDTDGIRWIQERWQPPVDERLIVSARVLMAEQRYSEAVRALERASEQEPGLRVALGRMLVEAYSVSDQLPLAREANDALASIDPGYHAVASYGLATVRGADADAWITKARSAAALGIPGVKTWATWLDVLALMLPGGSPSVLRDETHGHPLQGRNLPVDVGVVILAGALHDKQTIAAARASHFPQVAGAADALIAEERGDHATAAAAWRRVLELNADGRMQLYAGYARARALHASGDPAGVIAACSEVIVPRVFTWSWASTVGPCLRWSAEAATSLGRHDDAERWWRRLANLRADAPPDDELARAARTALEHAKP